MPQISHCLRARSKFTKLQKLPNDIVGFCTSLHGVKLFSYIECKAKAKIIDVNLNSETSAIAFSPDAKFIAYSVDSYIYVLDIVKKRAMKTIKVDDTKVDLLLVDLESKYIIAATSNGRVLQYKYNSSSLLARLCSFSSENKKSLSKKKFSPVSSFALHKELLASGGNDGRIIITNIHSRAYPVVIKNDNVRVTTIVFLDSAHIISADSKGNLYINSLKDNQLIKKIATGFTEVHQILLMPNPQYMMVAGNSNHIALYDINKFKLIQSKYFEFDAPIQSVVIADDNTLLATLENNSLAKVELPTTQDLRSLILHNSLDKAFQLIQNNPMLDNSKEHQRLESIYQKIYSEALEALTHQNRNKALELTNIFKSIESKKEDINMLFRAFDNYSRFKTLYREKKYALAYAMSQKFPALEHTLEYKKIEEIWKDAFKNAQRQILYGRYDNAKALLNTYIGVIAKRAVIELILNHNSSFIEFLKAIESKNYQMIYKIAKINKQFIQIPTFKNIEDEMQLIILAAQQDIENCDIGSAKEKISKLQNIDLIASKISELQDGCRAATELEDAYKEGNFLSCYELLDKHHFLNNTELGALLQQHWNRSIAKCEEDALKGNIKDIKLTLGELITLSSRRDKIGDLFRVSFHTKIKMLTAKELYKNAESVIYSYIDIFGIDNEIIPIMKLYEKKSKIKLAITQNQGKRQTRESWINSEIIVGKRAHS